MGDIFYYYMRSACKTLNVKALEQPLIKLSSNGHGKIAHLLKALLGPSAKLLPNVYFVCADVGLLVFVLCFPGLFINSEVQMGLGSISPCCYLSPRTVCSGCVSSSHWL